MCVQKSSSKFTYKDFKPDFGLIGFGSKPKMSLGAWTLFS